MTTTNALTQALEAWNRRTDSGEPWEWSFADAVALGEWEMFSKRNIAAITGLSIYYVDQLVTKKDKTGGVFNPEALPQLHQLWVEYAQGGKPVALMRTIVKQGVSQQFLAKLVGIPTTTVNRLLKETEASQ